MGDGEETREQLQRSPVEMSNQDVPGSPKQPQTAVMGSEAAQEIKRFQQKHEKSNLWLRFREFSRKLDYLGEKMQHVYKIMQKHRRTTEEF